MTRFLRLGTVLFAVAALFFALAGTATAHERRDVANGKYQFVVGFLNEPAIQGAVNGVSLRVTTKADNKPVEGVEKTLKVEVQNGGDRKQMDLETVFGQPGAYAAHFVPTKPGTYRFVFTGKVEDAVINETFESGPGRFDDVEPLADLQFPKVSATDGSGADATRLAAVEAQARAALDQAKETEGRVTTALAVGAAGLVVGLIGIAVGAVGFSAARRRS